ncbi:MAG: SDR family NAD(P)-dependent oxidoreductase [Pseudobdellovibrio sp.]|nr:SDR family NAD(P)-dependent oxidoreductase [Pseudobdellovibrio sp.]
MYKYIYWYKFATPTQDYKPVILLTGGSSEVGVATAKLLSEHSEYRLVVTARELTNITPHITESDHVWVMPLDVVDEESRKTAVAKIFERWGRVDIYINTSDICYRSSLEETKDQDDLLHIQKNYLGPVSLIRMLLPKMRKNGKGKIINISSVSGLLAFPTMSSYSASKYALEGAMEALWYELRPFGIDVSLVQPGFIHSQQHSRIKFSQEHKATENAHERPYQDMYNDMIPFVASLKNRSLSTPQSIAELTYNVIRTERPPLWVPASFDAEFFYYFKRWFPRRIFLPFFYWLLPGSKHWGQKITRKHDTIWIVRAFRNIVRYLSRRLSPTQFKKSSSS